MLLARKSSIGYAASWSSDRRGPCSSRSSDSSVDSRSTETVAAGRSHGEVVDPAIRRRCKPDYSRSPDCGAGAGCFCGQLRVGFYNVTCPAAEQIVRDTMVTHFNQDPKIAAHLLRVQFHDCAATSCDASLLLTGTNSEQDAPPNLTLLGFDVIDDMKANLEANCSKTVSSANILAMAARDAVSLTGGLDFSVPLGRFDSNFSGGVNVNLPSPDSSVPSAIAFFQTMGLSATDLVVLLGSHTIGAAHCSSFSDRLFNFNNTGSADPSMDPTFLASLQTTCTQPTNVTIANTKVALDFGSEDTFDNHIYLQMEKRQGVLALDQELFTHNLTTQIVTDMSLNTTLFAETFAASLVKMGQFGIKNSTTGVIRTQCFA